MNINQTRMLAGLCILLFAGLPFAFGADVSVDTLNDIADGDTSTIAALIASPGEDGHISLREAIMAANGTAGADTIGFSVRGSILVSKVMPEISDMSGGTTIDGCGEIALLGSLPPDSKKLFLDGLLVTSSNNVIHNIVMREFEFYVYLLGPNANENVIRGCHFEPYESNSRGIGILIEDGASNNVIGGVNPGEGNVVSGMAYAVFADNFNRPYPDGNNKIQGNYFGTDVSGLFPKPNDCGVCISRGFNGNIIGGDEPGAGNVICATWDGIILSENENNILQGNMIGTDVSGENLLGYGDDCGICVGEEKYALIGGVSEFAGNVIAGWQTAGIIIASGNYPEVMYECTIQGNKIGTDITGTTILGNNTGIKIYYGTNYCNFGGAAPGAGNVISGNSGYAMEFLTYGDFCAPSNNAIQGNLIGVDATGTQALPNGGGVYLGDGARDNLIGGAEAGAGNVIAHNTRTGVAVSGAETLGNTIRGNAIYGNGGKGISLSDAGNGEIAAPEFASTSPVTGSAAPNSIIEIFVDEENEGRVYLDTVVASDTGLFSSSVDLADYPGMQVTATATDAAGNTSEFGVSPAWVEACPRDWHSADQNRDFRVSLSELLRAIQFYNSGGFHCAASGVTTEDGYAPGPGDFSGCCPYAGDYGGIGPDGAISLSELLRIVQFFNAAGYEACDAGEDGFCVIGD